MCLYVSKIKCAMLIAKYCNNQKTMIYVITQKYIWQLKSIIVCSNVALFFPFSLIAKLILVDLLFHSCYLSVGFRSDCIIIRLFTLSKCFWAILTALNDILLIL